MPYFAMGNDTITLPQRFKTILSDYCNKKITIGIRPENLSFCKLSDQIGSAISATVDIVEPLGNRVDVHLSDNTGVKFIVNTDPHIEIRMNDMVKAHIDSEKIHIFESGESGKNITLSDSTLN